MGLAWTSDDRVRCAEEYHKLISLTLRFKTRKEGKQEGRCKGIMSDGGGENNGRLGGQDDRRGAHREIVEMRHLGRVTLNI